MKVLVLVPEVLVGTAAILALLPSFGVRSAGSAAVRYSALVLALVALVVELTLGAQLLRLFNGGFVQDRFALFAKLAILVALLVGTLATPAVARAQALAAACFAALAGMIAASATDLVTLWSALALGAVAGLRPVHVERVVSAWAPAVAALAAAAFGAALIYGVAGFSTLGDIQRVMAFEPLSVPLALVLLLVFASAGALAVAPLLAPLRAAGASQPLQVATALSLASPLLVLLKLAAALYGIGEQWAPYVAALAVLLLLAGGLTAVAARSLGSLVGSTLLVQLGWIVAAPLAPHPLGIAAGLFLFAVFLVAAVAVATASLGLAPLAGGLERLTGAVFLFPYRVVPLAVILLSLAGVPPLGGWFGEFAVATELARYGYLWLVGIAVLASALVTWAVVRLLRLALLEPLPLEVTRGGRRVAREPAGRAAIAAGVAAALVTAFGLFSYPIHSLAVQGGMALWQR